MSRPTIQSKDWNYEVIQEPIAHRGRQTGFWGNFRKDNGSCLGITTEQYGLLQNSEMMEAVGTALKSRALTGYDKEVVVIGDGERFFAKYTFKNNTLKNAVGDVFGYELTAQNSFDRTLRGSISLGFLRLACLNGMATLEKDFTVTKKHSSKVSVDFVGEAIDKAMERGKEALSVFDGLAKTRITDGQGMIILGNLENEGFISGLVKDEIGTRWLSPALKEDKGRNLYNLYNAATSYFTHQVSKDRFEYANKLSSNVLLKLVTASRKPEVLAKLVTTALPINSNN